MIKQLFILSVIILLAQCEEAKKAAPSDVVTLTKDTFESVLKENKFVFVEYYAPWCGHCKSLAPEWEKLATELKDYKEEKITIAKVDVTAERALGETAGIKGFPTLKLYREGKFYKDYSGGARKQAAMSAWLKKNTGPPAKSLKNAEEVKTFVADNKGSALVGNFKNKESEGYKAYITSVTTDKAFESFPAAEVLGGDVESVVLYRAWNKEQPSVTCSGDCLKDLKGFVVGNAFPLVEEISAQSWPRFMESGLKIAFVFYDEKDVKGTEAIKVIAEKVAKETKGKIKWGTFDGVKYARQMTMMRLPEGQKLPAFAMLDATKRTFYPYGGKNTLEEVLAYGKGVAAGTIEPHVKSQEIPKEQKEAVIVLVRKSFDQIVMDKTKDVLVEFYAPWCGHCKALAPKYLKLAEKLKSNKKLVIAKIDMTENDISVVEIKGYPTLYFFPSNNKDKPIKVEAARTAAGLEKFLRDNAVASKDDFPGEPLKEDSVSVKATVVEQTIEEEKEEPKKDEL